MNGSTNNGSASSNTTPARRRRRASRHATPPQRQRNGATTRERNGVDDAQEPKPLQRYAHKHKQALWPLTITACLIGGAGVFELLRVFAATPWCRPICYIMVGLTLALKAFSVHVANEGGPIALLPTPRRWLLTTSVLDAASGSAMLVDFQHWIGVFIHAIQMLRLDSKEREEILHKLGPTIRRATLCLRAAASDSALHDALVWEESDDDDDEVPVARPVSETSDLTPDAAAFVEAAAKINPWSTLVHILSTRAYRSLRANLSPSALAVSAAVPAGLVAAVLTRRDHRLVAQREGARLILTGGPWRRRCPLPR